REAAAVVLTRPARRLHDPVEGQEGAHDQLSHPCCPSDRIPTLVQPTAVERYSSGGNKSRARELRERRASAGLRWSEASTGACPLSRNMPVIEGSNESVRGSRRSDHGRSRRSGD